MPGGGRTLPPQTLDHELMPHNPMPHTLDAFSQTRASTGGSESHARTRAASSGCPSPPTSSLVRSSLRYLLLSNRFNFIFEFQVIIILKQILRCEGRGKAMERPKLHVSPLHICLLEWFGVTCSDQGRVLGLSLPANQLTGAHSPPISHTLTEVQFK